MQIRVISEGGKVMNVRTKQQIQDIYNRQIDRVYRVCYLYLKNEQDAYDAAHETFLRLMHKKPHLKNEEHEKAWLIRVAVNICKDILKSYWKKNWQGEYLPEICEGSVQPQGNILEEVLALPQKYRTLVYLHYYEGYAIEEIAKILKENASTLRSRLSEARKILRKELGEDEKNI